MNDLITHAGGKQTRPDFEVLFPAVREPWMSGERQAGLLGAWIIEHDFAAVQWVNGRLLVKALPVAQWHVEPGTAFPNLPREIREG